MKFETIDLKKITFDAYILNILCSEQFKSVFFLRMFNDCILTVTLFDNILLILDVT